MIRIRQIKVPILEEQTLQDKIAKQLRVNKQDIKNITIIKKSRPSIYRKYQVIHLRIYADCLLKTTVFRLWNTY